MGLFNIFKKKKAETSEEKLQRLFIDAFKEANEKSAEMAPIVRANSLPNNHNFGLCPENPICSPSLSGTEYYLSRLCTPTRERFTWSGYTSIRAKVGTLDDVGEDVYTLYLNGEQYTKLYFVPYVGKSEYPPTGLSFIDDNRDWDVERGAAEMGVSVETYQKIKKFEEENAKSLNSKNDTNIQTFNSMISSLASAIVQIPKSTEKQYEESIISSSDITCCDTILFSCFVIRAMCLNSAVTHSLAVEFSKKFVSEIVDKTLETYSSLEPFFDQMFENRMSFYDRIVEKNQDSENILKVLADEFEIILKSDLINNGYKDFSETSPLPILGIFKDFEYSTQIKTVFGNLPELVSPYLEQVQNYLSNNDSKGQRAQTPRTYTFTITPQELEVLCREVYQENPMPYRVPGFRLGKAPWDVVKKFFGLESFSDTAIKVFAIKKAKELGESNPNNIKYSIIKSDKFAGVTISMVI